MAGELLDAWGCEGGVLGVRDALGVKDDVRDVLVTLYHGLSIVIPIFDLQLHRSGRYY